MDLFRIEPLEEVLMKRKLSTGAAFVHLYDYYDETEKETKPYLLPVYLNSEEVYQLSAVGLENLKFQTIQISDKEGITASVYANRIIMLVNEELIKLWHNRMATIDDYSFSALANKTLDEEQIKTINSKVINLAYKNEIRKNQKFIPEKYLEIFKQEHLIFATYEQAKEAGWISGYAKDCIMMFEIDYSVKSIPQISVDSGNEIDLKGYVPGLYESSTDETVTLVDMHGNRFTLNKSKIFCLMNNSKYSIKAKDYYNTILNVYLINSANHFGVTKWFA